MNKARKLPRPSRPHFRNNHTHQPPVKPPQNIFIPFPFTNIARSYPHLAKTCMVKWPQW